MKVRWGINHFISDFLQFTMVSIWSVFCRLICIFRENGLYFRFLIVCISQNRTGRPVQLWFGWQKMLRSCYGTWYEAIAMFWGWQNLVGQVWLTGAAEHMTWNWVDPGSHLWRGSRTRHPWSPCLQLLSQLWKLKNVKFWEGWLVLQDNAKELWHFHRAVLVARWPPSTPPWRHQAAAGRD